VGTFLINWLLIWLLFVSPVWGVNAFNVVRETGIEAGLCVVLGGSDGTLEKELAGSGRLLVEGLTDNWETVYALRWTLAQAGVFPLANIQHTFDLSKLPYADNLVNLVVADIDALGSRAPSDAEIQRVLGYGGKGYLKKGGSWRVVTKSTPDDVDD